MKARRVLPILERRLAEVPAVALLGPRQAGKTTLALALAQGRNTLYLDLESERDRAKLAEPELCFPGGRLWAVEVKRSLAPRPNKGFHSACTDLEPERRFLVYPGEEAYPVGNDVEVISLPAMVRTLAEAGS